MACELEQQVQAYHDGELAAGDVGAVEHHLAGCEACRAMLAGIQRVSVSLASVEFSAMPAGMAGRLYRAWDRAKAGERDRAVLRFASWLTAVAAAVLVAGLLSLSMSGRGNSLADGREGAWEAAAVAGPMETNVEGGPGAALVQVAQWQAEDLGR